MLSRILGYPAYPFCFDCYFLYSFPTSCIFLTPSLLINFSISSYMSSSVRSPIYLLCPIPSLSVLPRYPRLSLNSLHKSLSRDSRVIVSKSQLKPSVCVVVKVFTSELNVNMVAPVFFQNFEPLVKESCRICVFLESVLRMPACNMNISRAKLLGLSDFFEALMTVGKARGLH